MYQPITDFRGGLDTRKMSLMLPAGTLIQCQNAHINQGAEIEKRKAFAPTAIGVSDSFGFQPVPAGIMIFGSANHAAVSFPSPLIYQQLEHPQTLAGGSVVNMAAVLHSCLFGNFPFVIAKFADGYIGCYYNGQLVGDFSSGVVLAYLAGNDTALAANIAQLVNNSNGYSAQVSGANLGVFSNPGNSYSATVITTGASNVSVATGDSVNYPVATVSNTSGKNSADGTTVTIGSQLYQFKNVMGAAFDVQIGSDPAVSLKNLYLAIGATGTAGVNYYVGTTANAVVTASNYVSTPSPTFTVTAIAINGPGVTENVIPGVSLREEGSTIPRATGSQAVGQFSPAAGIPATFAGNSLTGLGTGSTSVPASGATIIVTNGVSIQTYRFEASPSQNYDVQIGTHSSDCVQNLVNAINGTGTGFFAGTPANPNVLASQPVNTPSLSTVTISAILPGTGGNSITVTQSGTTHLVTNGALTGGVSNGISAITAGPVSASATFTPAPYLYLFPVVVGGLTYNFVNSLANEGDVQIGLTVSDSLQNLVEAINLSGTNLVNYQVTNLNPLVRCLPTLVNGQLVIVARTPGSAANGLRLVNHFGGAVLAGGSDAVALIAASVLWFPGSTLGAFTSQVVNAINQYTGTSGFFAQIQNQTVYVYTEAFDSYANDAVISVTSAGVAIGFCGFTLSLNQGTAANASVLEVDINGFKVTTGTGITIGSLTVKTVAGLVTAVAANINANSGAAPDGATPINTLWQAIPQGNAIYFSNITTTSNDPNQTITIQTDTTNILAVGVIGNFNLSAVVTPQAINFIRANNVTADTSPIVANCRVSGGFPPYAYYWQWLTGDTAFSVSDPTKQNVTFSRTDTAGAQSSQWVCKVTDSIGDTTTSNMITVYQP